MSRHVLRAQEIDMTRGNLWKQILLFSLPLMLSNLLQVLFNMADLAVVGRCVGAIALGSVGSTTMLIFLGTGILQGMGGGTNAVVARFIGAGDTENVKRSTHTAILLCLLTGIMLLLAGQLLCHPILSLMGTKTELIDGAVLYLRFYMIGAPAMALYNYGNAILSAVGDTKRPLLYLTIAGITNVLLNLFFVLVCDLGVCGVGLASALSQYLSAFLILRYLLQRGREQAAHGLVLSEIRLHPALALQILGIGIPAAIQYSLFAIANLVIQSGINSFDHTVVEGSAAAANADSLVWDTMAAFYTACTSFIAQNLGAGNKRRIRQSYGITLVYSAGIGLVLGGLLLLFPETFLSLFVTDAEVLAAGRTRLIIMAASYFISAFMDDATAAARGLGKSVMPTVIVILGSVVYRIAWVSSIFAVLHTQEVLYLVYPTAWTLTAIAGNLYFLQQYRRLP